MLRWVEWESAAAGVSSVLLPGAIGNVERDAFTHWRERASARYEKRTLPPVARKRRAPHAIDDESGAIDVDNGSNRRRRLVSFSQGVPRRQGDETNMTRRLRLG